LEDAVDARPGDAATALGAQRLLDVERGECAGLPVEQLDDGRPRAAAAVAGVGQAVTGVTGPAGCASVLPGGAHPSRVLAIAAAGTGSGWGGAASDTASSAAPRRSVRASAERRSHAQPPAPWRAVGVRRGGRLS